MIDQYEVTVAGEKKKVSGEKLIKVVARDVLMRRDSSSVSMMKEIREATEGQGINLTGSLATHDMTPEERKQRIAELEAKRANRK